jgi:hypothetical protein
MEARPESTVRFREKDRLDCDEMRFVFFTSRDAPRAVRRGGRSCFELAAE